MARPRYPEINRSEMREARTRLGWTFRQLEERCAELGARIDNTLLSQYERGLVRPSPERLPVIAEALGLGLAELQLQDAA
jgi:transcriptional regulator with XRE-family HTH domain